MRAWWREAAGLWLLLAICLAASSWPGFANGRSDWIFLMGAGAGFCLWRFWKALRPWPSRED